MSEPDFRYCSQCGCRTNAKMRACCEEGRAEDVELATLRARAEKAERERDEAREACVNSANAWLAAANHAEKAEQENARLREALAELVRLKDVKDLSDLVVSEQDRAAMLHFYEIDKPKAWAAARTALGGE